MNTNRDYKATIQELNVKGYCIQQLHISVRIGELAFKFSFFLAFIILEKERGKVTLVKLCIVYHKVLSIYRKNRRRKREQNY